MVSLAGLLTCGGCAVGPDFKAPAAPAATVITQPPLPAQTQATPVAGGAAQRFDPAAQLPSRWWTAYGSDRLDRLVADAFANSPTIASAQAALRIAQEQVNVQRGALFPTISGSAGVTREKLNGAAQGFPQAGSFLFTLYNASVSLSYDFDVFGGVRRGLEAQEAAREAQREELEATYQTLAANVVTAAVLEASLRAQIDATRELIASAQHEVDLSRQEFELGGAARSDVSSAESNLASVQATLPPLVQQLSAARSQLAVYLGKAPSEYDEAQFDLASLQLPLDIPLMMPSEIVRQRPDVRRAQALLHQASAQIGVATANMLPHIGLTGNFGDSAVSFRSLFTSNVFSLAGNVTQPLFQGGALNAKRRAAIATYDQSLAQYRQTVLLAFKNVADTLRALDTDAQTLAAQYRAQTAAADSLHLIEQRYGLGGANHLELLVAQQQYQRSRVAYVQALAARYQDTAALFLALGGDWKQAGQAVSAAP
ncbi:RND transporter [Trinickia dabaoshanensis]|uniref:RND transporter n=1 Tax=Trinickia dabaoshanensis TaxID=564714 RepID=A0A2N7VDC7_9BURK|nr:efflux transporter outer membrane subunit [Trinickia dabaoshanensis]PMS15145.1 RND transporter [Trinickia dabaoshanensis]